MQYVFQVLEIARSVTNQTSNDTAKELFIKRLNESDMYFADKPIPANESNANAHVLCSSVEGAKKYCPNRWRAMQNWFAEAKKVNSEIPKYMLQMGSLFLLFFSSFVSTSSCTFSSFPLPGGRGGGGRGKWGVEPLRIAKILFLKEPFLNNLLWRHSFFFFRLNALKEKVPL